MEAESLNGRVTGISVEINGDRKVQQASRRTPGPILDSQQIEASVVYAA